MRKESFKEKFARTNKLIIRNWQIYLLFLPVLIIIILFTFIPVIENIALSFKIDPASAIEGPFQNFIGFFGNDSFLTYLKNTLVLNVIILVFGFPASILLAILLYESKSKKVVGFTQTATFLPFFISIVVVTGIVRQFFAPNTGLFTTLFGQGANYLYAYPQPFRFIYSTMDVWQTLGYNTLIYYAALTTISPTLYEAAEIDGAGKFKQMIHVTLPGIASTIIITLLLRIGKIMQLGAEKVLLLQEGSNLETSQILGTYAYSIALAPRTGLPDYGLAAVAGLFDAIVAIILIYLSNKSAKRFSETSLW